MRRLVVVIPCAAIGLALGCGIIVGLDDDRVLGGPDASAPPPADAGCERASAPARPDAGGGGSTELVVAIHAVDIGEQPDAGPIGYDLDEHCTCQLGEGPSCKPAKWQDASTPPTCDDVHGRDDAVAALFKQLSAQGFESAGFSDRADKGNWSLLNRVKGWNEEPDDDQVEVAIFPTKGFSSTDILPSWDGTDEWPILESGVGVGLDGGPDLAAPIYVDKKAYVAGGELVATLPEDTTMLLGAEYSQVTVNLKGARIVARITPASAGQYKLEGVLAARWRLDDLFLAVSTFRDDKEMPICIGEIEYQFVKNKICSLPDIRGDGQDDGTERCDAVSFAFGFVADPAKLGELTPPPNDPTVFCDPDKDPATDECP